MLFVMTLNDGLFDVVTWADTENTLNRNFLITHRKLGKNRVDKELASNSHIGFTAITSRTIFSSSKVPQMQKFYKKKLIIKWLHLEYFM